MGSAAALRPARVPCSSTQRKSSQPPARSASSTACTLHRTASPLSEKARLAAAEAALATTTPRRIDALAPPRQPRPRWTAKARNAAAAKPYPNTAGSLIGRSARADPEENNLDRLQKHHQVEDQAVVLDIVEVVFELLLCIFLRGAVAVAHLGPAGDARLDEMALLVERHPVRELGDEFRALRPRPDEAHVAEQHVDRLGQLVDPQPADPGAHPRHARVVELRPHRAAVALGVHAHAAALDHAEGPAVVAGAQLPVQDRSAVLQPDRCGGSER